MSQLHKPSVAVRARRMATRYGVTGGKLAAALLLVVLALVAAAGIWFSVGSSGVVVERSANESAGSVDDAGDESSSGGSREQAAALVVVHVDGAVAAPGVYVLAEGSRVNDAVLAAGGLTEEADTSTTNLAAPVTDGAKVHVPTEGELAAPVAVGEDSSGAVSPGSGSATSGLVNINTAASAELQTLSGVGEATAQSIIEDRESNGPFASPEDLMRVSGIGEKKFAKIKDHICV